jgi:hypothetical protein
MSILDLLRRLRQLLLLVVIHMIDVRVQGGTSRISYLYRDEFGPVATTPLPSLRHEREAVHCVFIVTGCLVYFLANSGYPDNLSFAMNSTLLELSSRLAAKLSVALGSLKDAYQGSSVIT